VPSGFGQRLAASQRIQPGWVADHDASPFARDDPALFELRERPCDELPDRAKPGGELRLGQVELEVSSGRDRPGAHA